MGNSFFHSITKIIAIILVLLLVISFMVSGVGTSIRGITLDKVATAGKADISAAEWRDATSYQIQRARGGLGLNIDEEGQEQIKQQTLELLIDKKLMMQETDRLGIRVGKEHVIDNIKNNRMFKIDGKFDEGQYKLMLGQIGENDKTYYNSLKYDLAYAMASGVYFNSPVVPDELVNLLHIYDAKRQSVLAAIFPVDVVKEVSDPLADELKKYFEANKETFDAPEYRTVSYIELTKKDVEEEIDTSDASLRALYEEDIEQYSVGETRILEQIFADEEEQIKEIYEALEGGKDFYETAKDMANQDKKAVSYGSTEKIDLAGIIQDEEIEEIFNTEDGKYTHPIHSVAGWHVFRVVSRKEPYTKTFEEVKDKVRKDLLNQQSGDVLYQLAGSVEDELAGGATLAEVANNLNLKLKKVEQISLEGTLAGGVPMARYPDYGDFLPMAFSLTLGAISQMVGSEDGLKYYVQTVNSITPSRQRTLDEVRDSVVKTWKDEKKIQLQIARAQEFAKKMEEVKGEGRLQMFKDKAEDMGAEIREVKSVYRNNYNETILPGEAVAELFEKNLPYSISKSYLRTDKAMVVAITEEIFPAEEDDPVFSVDTVRGTTTRDLIQDYTEQFRNHLRRIYSVSYHNR